MMSIWFAGQIYPTELARQIDYNLGRVSKGVVKFVKNALCTLRVMPNTIDLICKIDQVYSL